MSSAVLLTRHELNLDHRAAWMARVLHTGHQMTRPVKELT